MDSVVPVVLNAMTYVCVLALVALGLAIIFGMMDIMNLAHGEFITIGAYTLSLVQRVGGPETTSSTYWLGLALAPLIGALGGALLEATIIRPLYRRTLDTLLATFAISLILQKVIELSFGAQPQIVSAPFTGSVSILGVEYPGYRVLIIGLAVATIALCMLVFTRTRFGTDLRAVIQNSAMAEAVGIDTRRLNRIAFAGGAALAAFAGALIAPLASVEAHLGLFYLGKAFFVIVLGGIGSVVGSILGSTLVGTGETLLNYVLDPSLASALILILAIVIIRFRPRGLVPGFSAAHHLLGKE